MVVDIPDVVIYTNFGDHRLRGFWVAGVKFRPLPLTFIVALTTLPCERVISTQNRVFSRMRRSVTAESIPTKYYTSTLFGDVVMYFT